MIHHKTISKYTAALLNLFSGVSVEQRLSNGVVKQRKIPLTYATKEKINYIKTYSVKQLLEGNTNVIPFGKLGLITIIKYDSRQRSPALKISTVKSLDSIEYQYNSVPYTFTYELAYMCRGMDEATMIVEQIAPIFNPIVEIDVYDGENLAEPTRIPVKLLDISIEDNGYDDFSNGMFNVNFGLEIVGNFYPPIKTIERIKQYKISTNEITDDNYYNTKSVFDFDVFGDKVSDNYTKTDIVDVKDFSPEIIDIVCDGIEVGERELEVIFEDVDNRIDQLQFEWDILQGENSSMLETDNHRAVLNISQAGKIEIQVKITDPHGNESVYSKEFIFDALMD